MKLKEAFRYQNFLEDLFDCVVNYLTFDPNTTATSQEHMRKKANPEAEDEIVNTTQHKYDYDNNLLIHFLLDLIDERSKLTSAIAQAKAKAPRHMDAEILINKMRQSAANCFTRMAKLKPTESIIKGTGFKFNADGNQVPYTYDIKVVQSIDFDRNMVRNLAQKLLRESDEVSSAIDAQVVNTDIPFTPKYFVSGTLEDAVEAFQVWHEANHKSI